MKSKTKLNKTDKENLLNHLNHSKEQLENDLNEINFNVELKDALYSKDEVKQIIVENFKLQNITRFDKKIDLLMQSTNDAFNDGLIHSLNELVNKFNLKIKEINYKEKDIQIHFQNKKGQLPDKESEKINQIINYNSEKMIDEFNRRFYGTGIRKMWLNSDVDTQVNLILLSLFNFDLSNYNKKENISFITENTRNAIYVVINRMKPNLKNIQQKILIELANKNHLFYDNATIEEPSDFQLDETFKLLYQIYCAGLSDLKESFIKYNQLKKEYDKWREQKFKIILLSDINDDSETENSLEEIRSFLQDLCMKTGISRLYELNSNTVLVKSFFVFKDYKISDLFDGLIHHEYYSELKKQWHRSIDSFSDTEQLMKHDIENLDSGMNSPIIKYKIDKAIDNEIDAINQVNDFLSEKIAMMQQFIPILSNYDNGCIKITPNKLKFNLKRIGD